MSLGVPKKAGLITTPVLVLLLIAIIVGGAIALSLLLTQTAPSVPSAPASITSSCTTLSFTPSTAPLGNGVIRFQCGTGPAFTSTGASVVQGCVDQTSTTCSSAPPAPYNSAFGYVLHSATNCNTITTLPQSPTSTPIPAGDYDYCGSYTGLTSGSLPTFTVTWNQ